MKNLNRHKVFSIKWISILLLLLLLELNLEIQAQYISNNGAYISISSDTNVHINTISNENDATLSNNGILHVTAIQNNGNITGNGVYNITGDFISTGEFLSQSGTVNMQGTSAQTMEMGATTFYNLTIDNAAAVTLSSEQTVLTNILTINSGKIFKIEAAKNLTVTGTISNFGGTSGLILKSNNTGTASLIHNSSDLLGTVQRYISGAPEDWHFLSAPVSDQNISGSWNPTGTYGNGTGYDLYIFNEPTPCWTYQLNTTVAPTWASIHPTLNFVEGRGYLYAAQAPNPTKEFIGLLNNGDISYPLTSESPDPAVKGFNLIGNPYTAAIDWKAATGWTRTGLVSSGGGYDMWIWNPAVNNYGVYNSSANSGTNGVTQYIAPTQGYFVRTAANGAITMSNATQVNTGASNWLKAKHTATKNTEINSFKVRITSKEGYGSDEVLLQFGFPQNEPGALKLFSQNEEAPSAYFQSKEQNLSVRYLTDVDENSEIPLQFHAGKNGAYSLQIDTDSSSFDFLLLADTKTDIVTDLKLHSTYEFTADSNDSKDRFRLHFKPITEEPSNAPVLIFYDGKEINIDLTLLDGPTDIQVFDLLGRLIINKKEATASVHRIKVYQKHAIFIVVVLRKGKAFKRKILVR
ncbi:MAG: hypothetical protein ACI6PN_06340 [Polaribacter sp.]|uniref:hypothetical protein n=1 Tax=Polaribacter sp. TaxID=1920175 RepID=UPI00384F72E2